MSNLDVHESLFRAMDEKPLNASTQKRLVALAQQGSKEASDILVTSNLRFVYNVARRYFPHNDFTRNEMMNLGAMGIIGAIRLFDINSKNTFMSYAVFWIRRELSRHLRDYARIIRQPANKQGDMGFNYVGFDDPMFEDGKLSISDTIVQDTYENPETALETKTILEAVYAEIEKFPVAEKYYVIHRFGLNGNVSEMQDMARHLKVGKNAMSFIAKKALKRLQNIGFAYNSVN